MFKKLIVSKALRRRVSWIIASVLILPFILFFHSSFQNPSRGPGGVAGELFGRPVPWETYQRELQWVRTQWQGRFGDNAIPEAMEPMLIPQAWERLTLLAEAHRKRLRVSDQELATFIQQLPAFQDGGRFVPERYHRDLAALGTNPQAFEELLRRDLLIERLINSRTGDVSVMDEEILNAYQQAHERVRASLIRRDVEAFREAARQAITEEELRARYEAHPEDVRIPAQISLDYLGRTAEELRGSLTVSEEEIAEHYAHHPEEFAGEDGAVKPLDDVRPSIRERLLSRQIRQRLVELAIECEDALNAKVSLEELAQRAQLSIRTVGPLPVALQQAQGDRPERSRGAVGDLGAGGVPEPAVLEAAFSLQEGEVSRVVETDNGVYVVRVTRREPMRVPPLEEARPTVVERVLAEKSREAARADLSALHGQLQAKLSEGIAAEEAFRILGIEPSSPEPFTRSEPIEGVGSVPAVNTAAFAAAIGALTDVVETPSGFVVLLVHERLAAEASGLTEEERGRLRGQLKNERQQERLAEWMQDVRERANLKSYVEETPPGS